MYRKISVHQCEHKASKATIWHAKNKNKTELWNVECKAIKGYRKKEKAPFCIKLQRNDERKRKQEEENGIFTIFTIYLLAQAKKKRKRIKNERQNLKMERETHNKCERNSFQTQLKCFNEMKCKKYEPRPYQRPEKVCEHLFISFSPCV